MEAEAVAQKNSNSGPSLLFSRLPPHNFGSTVAQTTQTVSICINILLLAQGLYKVIVIKR